MPIEKKIRRLLRSIDSYDSNAEKRSMEELDDEVEREDADHELARDLAGFDESVDDDFEVTDDL